MNSFKVRFIPLGGVVGVTKNLYVYELYENENLKDILIIDCGIGFPVEKELGIDFVIPDISYLKDKIDKIRAVLLTHGHEDHISALPFHYENLGKPQVYASKLTKAFLENKFKEHNQKPVIQEIKYDMEYRFGEFAVQFIRVTHSIPDALHIKIKTPVGTIYHGADFKFDITPPYGPAPDFYSITKAGKENVLCLLSDCLGVEREGFTLSESIVGQTFEDEMRKTKGKFFMTTFSSNISRIRQCVEAAIKFNRKIVFLGRSMKENTKIAKEIKYLSVPHNLTGKEQGISKIPSNKICAIVAGSQGQYNSALSKIARKQNPNLKIMPGDKIVFSSDPIPGNENEVYSLIEELSVEGADVVYSDIQGQLHASGHGNREDLKYLVRFTNPKFFIPIGGDIRHQKEYANMVEEMGFKRDNVFCLLEGNSIVFTKNNAKRSENIKTKNIYVDAYGIGDVGSIVLRDRQNLSSEGIVVALVTVDKSMQLVTKPKILSKGFIFEKQESKLLIKASQVIESVMKSKQGKVTNIQALKQEIINSLENFFLNEKGRKPLIVAEVIQV